MTTALPIRLLSAVAIAALVAQPGWAQETPEPAEDAPAAEAPADDAPAEDAPAEDATAEDAPAEDAPAEDAPAEDTPADEGAGEPPADDAAGAAPADPDAGAAEAEAAEPEVLEIVRETHGDWEVRCLPDGNECFLYQLALDETENPVAEFSLVKLPAGSDAVAGVTVVTPLGTLLPAGVVLQVDSGEARQYEFTFCSQVGCFARFGLTQASVDAMKRGRTGRMQLVSIGAPDQPVTLEVSLAGFTAAYDSLEVPPAPAEGD